MNTGRKVAIKFEYVKIPRVTLPTERRNYTIVKEHSEWELTKMLQCERHAYLPYYIDSIGGIPKIYSFGRTKDKNFRYLVMDKLSDSLAKIKKNFKHFSIKTTLMIGTQLVWIYEYKKRTEAIIWYFIFSFTYSCIVFSPCIILAWFTETLNRRIWALERIDTGFISSVNWSDHWWPISEQLCFL